MHAVVAISVSYFIFWLPGKAQPLAAAQKMDIVAATGTMAEPCDLFNASAEKATGLAATPAFQKAVDLVAASAASAPLREHILAFGKDSNGQVVLSPVSTGGSRSGVVPYLATAFADLHNHPKNTPPSSGDLYGLLAQNQRHQGYTTRFVITAAGTLYALFVFDAAAATTFLASYPPQRLSGYSPLFPEGLLNEFRAIRFLHGAAEELAMAWILETYCTGVVLLKQAKDGRFTPVRTKLVKEGDQRRYTAYDCR